jgi:hypothetical protein
MNAHRQQPQTQPEIQRAAQVQAIYLTCPSDRSTLQELADEIESQFASHGIPTPIILYGVSAKRREGFLLFESAKGIPPAFLEWLKGQEDTLDYVIYEVPPLWQQQRQARNQEEQLPGPPEGLRHFWQEFLWAANNENTSAFAATEKVLRAWTLEMEAVKGIRQITPEQIKQESYAWAIQIYESAINDLQRAADAWYEARQEITRCHTVAAKLRSPVSVDDLQHICLTQHYRVLTEMLRVAQWQVALSGNTLTLHENERNEQTLAERAQANAATTEGKEAQT